LVDCVQVGETGGQSDHLLNRAVEDEREKYVEEMDGPDDVGVERLV
jgi:hypothetical protein